MYTLHLQKRSKQKNKTVIESLYRTDVHDHVKKKIIRLLVQMKRLPSFKGSEIPVGWIAR
jgi:hypothetical protein